MWTRRFVSVLLAMILAAGLVALPRQAAAIDDNWWFLDPPTENAGDPDGAGPGNIRHMQVLASSLTVTVLSRISPSLAAQWIRTERIFSPDSLQAKRNRGFRSR
jgi:hypothetical protein